jgi:hypothetical protein
VKTSAWLLTGVERPAFRVAGRRLSHPADPNPPASRPLHDLLTRITRPEAAGRGWISRAMPSQNAMSGYVPAGSGISRDMITRLCADVDAAWKESWSWPLLVVDENIKRRLAGLRHRIFLEPGRFEAVLDREVRDKLAAARSGGPTYFPILDIRFFPVLGQMRCHVSMTIWNDGPRHPEHAPPELRGACVSTPSWNAEHYRSLFEDVATAAERLLRRCGFRRVDRTVGDGAHGLPVFWVVSPNGPAVDPIDYLRDGTRAGETTNHLARILLKVGHANDTIVSQSVLGGDLLALRRPGTDPAGLAVPYYLILPGGRPLARSPDRTGPELKLFRTITRLTTLETEGASRLLAIKADLEIWRHHLNVYSVVVDRAVALWDALSTHLPIRRRAELSATHRAMEMLHQILLQAIGDLGNIATQVTEARADIKEIADDLSDRFNAKLTERHPPSRAGLRTGLTETGLFGHANREADEIAAEAQRVKGAYDDLLQAISFAFDERRAREVDALQRFNYGLGLAVAMVALVTVLEATVDMKPDPSEDAGAYRTAALSASWGLGMLLLGVVASSLIRSWKLDKLGSRVFRILYDGRRIRRWLARKVWPTRREPQDSTRRRRLRPPRGIWQMLKDMSTDLLEEQAFTDHDWKAEDRCLASEFAMMWDEVTATKGLTRRNGARRDITALSRQIERWGMQTLLLTERPRRLYRYPLPTLTCLFRCCEKLDGWRRNGSYSRPVSLMAAEDFDRSLTRLGFRGREIRRIDAWLIGRGRRYPDAATALRTVLALNLKPSMTAEERRAALRIVSRDAATATDRQGRSAAVRVGRSGAEGPPGNRDGP